MDGTEAEGKVTSGGLSHICCVLKNGKRDVWINRVAE